LAVIVLMVNGFIVLDRRESSAVSRKKQMIDCLPASLIISGVVAEVESTIVDVRASNADYAPV